MTINVRLADLTDIEELSRLFNGYRMFYEQASDIELARNFLNERLKRQDSVIFVAEKNSDQNDSKTLGGFTQLYPSFSSVAAHHVWVLNDLFVDQDARQLGVGRALMNRAKDYGIETKAKRIELSTDTSNVNAQALYESLGYQLNSSAFYYSLELT